MGVDSPLVCTKCGQAPSISKRERKCKACVAERKHAWHERNKEYVSRKNAERYAANRERIKTATTAYRAAHPDETVARQRRRYEKKRDEILAVTRRYAQANKEKLRAAAKAYRDAHKEELKAKSRAYIRANSARIVARVAEYRRNHPEKESVWRRTSSALRRTRTVVSKDERAVITDFTKLVVVARRIRCYWCGAWAPKGEREIDHIIPLARGGPHAAANLCCACAKCNRSKSSQMPEDFSGQYELQIA